MDIGLGITNKIMIMVTDNDTAEALGSGSVNVFATPKMITLMEKASALLVSPYLQENETTVGTKVNIEHVVPTPVGMEVTIYSRLIGVDNRKLTFEVEAYDTYDKIGIGTHERFVVDTKKFMQKTYKK